ncbi:HAD family phosphatase [Bradyrhizobium sp. Tv2a-2]|uniref:HAD family hydrolase n=1 Tax=Bradyrhizobium sp. Tv2a-2 TaxID=113395 RepID=UPI00041E05CB|nr:HAD family phosphatase [Bradyrhizobium sp. Tv2a-2]
MTLPRKAQAVVFDMDGLLFNTEAIYRDATISVAREAGYQLPLDFYLATIGLPGEATRARFGELFGNAFDFDGFWSASTQRFREATAAQLYLKAGVIELLDLLDELQLPRAIATSSRHEDARHHLDTHGLHDRFHAIVAHGDYAQGKPNPDPFLKAAERLGVDPALCLALEDSHNGVRAASRAGMMTVMVPDLLAPDSEMQSLCLCIARNLHEVCSLIRQ